MVEPAIDSTGAEWCYLAKSTTVIGLPYQPDVAQVTFDGALFTGQAELCFSYGAVMRPVLARQKTFLEGWIPIVTCNWLDETIRFDMEILAAPLDPADVSNTIQFVQVRMRNQGRIAAAAIITAALRGSGEDHRFGKLKFDPHSRYEMTQDAVLRDRRAVYLFPSGGQRFSVPGQPYEGPFDGARFHVTRRAEVCLTRYERTLAPGEEASLVFKMPRVPVASPEEIERIRQAGYGPLRERTIGFWKALIPDGSGFEIPEARVQSAWRQSIVHLQLATRERNGERYVTDGLPYPQFFMLSFIDHQLAGDSLGLHSFTREAAGKVLRQQLPDGLFSDVSVGQGRNIWVSHGHMMHALSLHCLMTQDRKYARTILPAVRRGVDWLQSALDKDQYTLLPPVWPYDAEMIDGHYTSHNLYALLGLRSAIRLAGWLEAAGDERAWQELHARFEESVLKALRATAGDDGYVPTGLYHFLTGPEARGRWKQWQTNQDWENMCLAWPTEVLAPSDRRLTRTLAKLRREKYREGIMTYRHYLHQYLTTNVTEQHLARDEQELALLDLYHVLLHCGSTGEGFENLVLPWELREVRPNVPPPHAWAASKILVLIRNMLVCERGGRAGLDQGARDLHLFTAVSPAWATSGKTVSARNIVTEMGRITAAMKFRKDGADVSIESAFHRPPRELALHIPYFVELRRFTAKASHSRVEEGMLRLSPDATRISLDWRPRPGAARGAFAKLLLAYRNEWERYEEAIVPGGQGRVSEVEERHASAPLSFGLVRAAYQYEYARRAAGTKRMSVDAPSPLGESERAEAFRKAFPS